MGIGISLIDDKRIKFSKGRKMKTVRIYDRAMCCSTGVCGPQIDPALPRFAADLDWLKTQGHHVERFNLAQQPAAFIQNADVQRLLADQGTECLPVIVIDGRVASRGGYPTREMLSIWTRSLAPSETPVVAKSALRCCGGKACC